MARYTQWDYVKRMLIIIAIMVMIFGRALSAMHTGKTRGWGHTPGSYSVKDSPPRSILLLMTRIVACVGTFACLGLFVTAISFTMNCFADCGRRIGRLGFSSLRAVPIGFVRFLEAHNALIGQAVRHCPIPIKRSFVFIDTTLRATFFHNLNPSVLSGGYLQYYTSPGGIWH